MVPQDGNLLKNPPACPQLEALVERWYAAVAPISFSNQNEPQTRRRLYALAHQTTRLLFAETYCMDQARTIGSALVDLDCTEPEALEATLIILEQYLRSRLPSERAYTLNNRISLLLTGIASGFTGQLRNALLQEREALQANCQQVEQALRASEESLRMVLVNAPIALMTTDQAGKITLAAGRSLEEANLRPEDLVGHMFVECFLDRQRAVSAYHRARAGESITWNSDYGDRVYEARFNPLRDSQGTIIGVIGLGIDVTTQVRIQQELEEEREKLVRRVAERTDELQRSNAELRRINKLKDNFVATMSHELRTPLHAMLVVAESLRTGVYGNLSREQQNRLEQIETSGKHLQALIDDILDLTRIDSNKMELNLQSVDVGELCQISLKFIEAAATQKQIRIAASFDPWVRTIQADSRRLLQILLNLLDNALKFTPPNGTIGLQVIGDESERVVQFIVWDTGSGIAAENLPHLFQPFVQVDGSLARQQQGTGLGLVLVYHLARLHHGNVEVLSEPEYGSRFIVTIPWQQTGTVETAAAVDDQTAIRPILTGEPTVVLAEDHAMTEALLRDYLQAQGYQVVVARNGLEAIQRIRETEPVVVIMDIQMPEMDGLEAIKHIRAIPEQAHIPIIAMTALAMPGDRERCLAAGANEYVSKPISLQHLVATIERLRRTE